MQSLIIGGCTLVDVDNHAGVPTPGEEALEHTGQFAVPERNHRLFCPVGETQCEWEGKNTSHSLSLEVWMLTWPAGSGGGRRCSGPRCAGRC